LAGVVLLGGWVASVEVEVEVVWSTLEVVVVLDIINRITDGLYKSSIHWVVNKNPADRFSVV
jgi:isopenicillin N synthase-like dioxygenase